MNIDMNMSKLSKKRQKNVQEQNTLTEASIRKSAVWFRESHDFPRTLIVLLEKKGINLETAILSWHDRMPFGGPSFAFRGEWVTVDGRFFHYEVEMDKKEKAIERVELEEMTESTEVNEHKRGNGKTYGFLCLKVLQELNNS
jgi:hypothetical protein